MRDKIGFIAVGQAGGNIGMLFEKAGHTVLCTNTSKQDLATLTNAKHTYYIKGGEGSNKNRDKAKELVINDFEGLLEKIQKTIQEEYVFVIFSSGGGTGSGASPMLIDMLIQHTNKTVGAITILPSHTEPIKPAINSYECFKELEQIDRIASTFVLDNSKKNKFSINHEFVSLFRSLLKVPQYQNIKGNIDAAEIKELLSTRGMAIISKLAKTTNNGSNNGSNIGSTKREQSNASIDHSVTPRLIKSLSENIFAPMESDEVIKYIGISSPVQIDMDAVMRETGVCLDVFSGLNPDYTICMLAGLTLPYTALEILKTKVDSNKDAISNSLVATRETKLSDGINFVADERPPSSERPAPDMKSVFAKYMKK